MPQIFVKVNGKGCWVGPSLPEYFETWVKLTYSGLFNAIKAEPDFGLLIGDANKLRCMLMASDNENMERSKLIDRGKTLTSEFYNASTSSWPEELFLNLEVPDSQEGTYYSSVSYICSALNVIPSLFKVFFPLINLSHAIIA